jgi:hypothetical protein
VKIGLAVRVERSAEKYSREKDEKLMRVSHIRRTNPSGPIATNFGEAGVLAYYISYAEFAIGIYQAFRLTGCQFLAFL